MAFSGQNQRRSRRHWFRLGERVRLRSEPKGTIGVVAAIMLDAPFRALVIWRDELWTFEPLDALTEVVQRLL
jgi:hypothetical protein